MACNWIAEVFPKPPRSIIVLNDFLKTFSKYVHIVSMATPLVLHHGSQIFELVIAMGALMTQSRLMSWYESCRWAKVKVVKWCRKKRNEHNLMYICHQQCEIMHKFQRNSSNGQFLLFSLCAGESSLLKTPIFDENSRNKIAFFSMFSNSMT